MYGLLMNLTLLASTNTTNAKIVMYSVIIVIALIVYFIKTSMIKSENRKKSEERERKRQQLMYQQMMQQGMPPQGIQPMGMQQQGVQQNLNQGMGPAEKGNGNTGTMTYTCGSCGADFESDEFPNFCPECGAGKENINRK